MPCWTAPARSPNGPKPITRINEPKALHAFRRGPKKQAICHGRVMPARSAYQYCYICRVVFPRLGFCALAVGGPTQCKSRKPIIMYQSSIRNPRQGHSLFCKRTREPGSNPDSKTGIIAPSHHLVHRSPSKPTINPIPPISSNPPGFIPKSESQTQNLNPRTLTRNQSQTLNPNRCFTSTS